MSIGQDFLKCREEQKALPIEFLRPSPNQPREVFNEEDMEALVESIAATGVIQPIVVRPNELDPSGRSYLIISGERRWRACQRAGVYIVPTLVKYVDADTAYFMAVTENVARVDLNPIEEAKAFAKLETILEARGVTKKHDTIAAIVAKSRAKVSNAIRLLELSPAALSLAAENPKTVRGGHLVPLIGLAPGQQVDLIEQCIAGERSARWMEAQARKLKAKRAAEQKNDAERKKQQGIAIKQVETAASEAVGNQVSVTPRGEKGYSVEISFHSAEELQGFLEKLGVETE